MSLGNDNAMGTGRHVLGFLIEQEKTWERAGQAPPLRQRRPQRHESEDSPLRPREKQERARCIVPLQNRCEARLGGRG